MTRKTRLLALGAGVSGLVLAAHLGLGALTRSAVEAALREVPGARHGPVSVDTLSGRVTIADVDIRGSEGQRLHVGSVTLPTPYAMISPALAAGDVSFDAVDVTFGAFSVAIPHVDIAGTDNSREEIAAVFDLQNGRALTERLASLSAASVSMPEMAIAVKQPEGGSRTVYKDIRINGLKAGVIRSLAASGGVMDGTGQNGEVMRASFGPITVNDIDLPLIATAYVGGGAPGGEMRVAQGQTTVDSMAFGVKGPAGNVAITVGRMAMKGSRMRPVATPLLPLVQEFAGRKSQDIPTEDAKRLLAGVVAFYESFALDGFELTDIAVEGPTGSGHGKVARVAFAGAQVGKPNDLRFEGIEITGQDGYGRIGAIAHTGWSYAGTLKALREAAAQPGNLQDTIDPRSLIPEIGTLAFRDVELDVPDTKARAADPKAPNIHMGLKGFEFTASDPLAGMPTALRLSTDRFTLAIPPGEKADGLKDLVAMGYRELDLSSTIDARWSEAAGELSLNQLSFQGVNMGNVSLRGVIGGVSRDVFIGDATTAQIALLGATVKQATLTVENKGLFEKALDMQAKSARKSPDQLRKEFAAAAQVGIPAMLGNSPAAKQIAQAAAKFVAKPNRLTLSAKSRDPAGLGLADLGASGGDPRAILDALTVTATAE